MAARRRRGFGDQDPGTRGPGHHHSLPRQFLAVDARRGGTGDALVGAVSDAIGRLEGHGRFGPFAVVLGQQLFLIAQTPNVGSLVLPQDRIIPFLGGGPLLRSSTLNANSGVVVALGGAPVELVLGTDVSLQFLQITARPSFLFRVREKLALRIKEIDAIVRLELPDLSRCGGHTEARSGRG